MAYGKYDIFLTCTAVATFLSSLCTMAATRLVEMNEKKNWPKRLPSFMFIFRLVLILVIVLGIAVVVDPFIGRVDAVATNAEIFRRGLLRVADSLAGEFELETGCDDLAKHARVYVEDFRRDIMKDYTAGSITTTKSELCWGIADKVDEKVIRVLMNPDERAATPVAEWSEAERLKFTKDLNAEIRQIVRELEDLT